MYLCHRKQEYSIKTPMKSEDKEVNINEVAIALEVDSDMIDKVRSGEVTHIVLQINEQNQNMILESI
jgi:hypothetical protein